MENRNIYKGHRYVPKIMGEWDNQEQYEGLCIVTHQGTSYTSKQGVPVGIDINNDEYWVVTGNYNAQVDTYRQEVRDMQDEVNSKVDHSELDNTMNVVNQQLKQIAYNPTHYGAMFDGVTDDSDAIIQAMTEAKETGGEVLLSGKVGVSQTLEIPSGVSINSYNATIIVLEDVDVIEFNRNTNIKGTLTIDTRNVIYTSSVLHFDGEKRLSYRDINIDTVFLQGSHVDGMGNAIHLESSTPDSSISFVYFKKVVIRGFEKGIFLDTPPADRVLYNYVNGNIIDNAMISDCDYYIYATGDRSENSRNQVDGNSFNNIMLQYSGRAIELLHMEGRYNYFEGFSWDSSRKDVKIVNLTSTSTENNITMHGSKDLENYEDNGLRNFVSVLHDFYNEIPYKSVSREAWGRRYEGDYQDILHKADKVHSITTTGDERITTGSLSDIFQGEAYAGMRLDLDNNTQFSFEIDFKAMEFEGIQTNYLYGGLRNLGISFLDDRLPNQVIIDVTDNNNGVKNTVIDLEGKSVPAINITREGDTGFNTHISKLKVTFIGKQGNDVRIGRVYANSFYIGGKRFLSSGGGYVAGNVNIIDSYLALGEKTTVPANLQDHHRRIAVVSGGSGSADRLMICLKQSDGSYEWVQIV